MYLYAVLLVDANAIAEASAMSKAAGVGAGTSSSSLRLREVVFPVLVRVIGIGAGASAVADTATELESGRFVASVLSVRSSASTGLSSGSASGANVVAARRRLGGAGAGFELSVAGVADMSGNFVSPMGRGESHSSIGKSFMAAPGSGSHKMKGWRLGLQGNQKGSPWFCESPTMLYLIAIPFALPDITRRDGMTYAKNIVRFHHASFCLLALNDAALVQMIKCEREGNSGREALKIRIQTTFNLGAPDRRYVRSIIKSVFSIKALYIGSENPVYYRTQMKVSHAEGEAYNSSKAVVENLRWCQKESMRKGVTGSLARASQDFVKEK